MKTICSCRSNRSIARELVVEQRIRYTLLSSTTCFFGTYCQNSGDALAFVHAKTQWGAKSIARSLRGSYPRPLAETETCGQVTCPSKQHIPRPHLASMAPGLDLDTGGAGLRARLSATATAHLHVPPCSSGSQRSRAPAAAAAAAATATAITWVPALPPMWQHWATNVRLLQSLKRVWPAPHGRLGWI